MSNAKLTQQLTDLGQEIDNLKTKSTELNTELNIIDTDLEANGIKNPEKAGDTVKKLMKEVDEINSQITDLIDSIENLLEEEDDESE